MEDKRNLEGLVTLVLILHNRHANLDRLLQYYQHVNIPIIIADSSKEKHFIKQPKHLYNHIYNPSVTFTEKIENVLQKVTTPYLVMCADDDFIIPESIIECVSFLESNKDYSICEGNCAFFVKSTLTAKKIMWGSLYKPKDYSIEEDEPLTRLEKMFEQYRSVLYAVHRTDVLRTAFQDAGRYIKNLFLNEYLTAVVPIITGKYKHLPILYQVREFAEDSDDKVTDNINAIFNDSKYVADRDLFMQFLQKSSSKICDINESILGEKLNQIFQKFAASPLVGNKPAIITFKRRIGQILEKLPVLGNWTIEQKRSLEREFDFKKIVQTKDDKEHLNKVAISLKNENKTYNSPAIL